MKNILLVVMLLTALSVKAQQTKTPEQLQKECLDEAHKSQDYKKVYADVHELKTDIQLAKAGSLSKTQVVTRYNKLLAGYMGHKNTFNEVDQRVNNDGDKLIQMVLLKTAGRIALEKAAELDKH